MVLGRSNMSAIEPGPAGRSQSGRPDPTGVFLTFRLYPHFRLLWLSNFFFFGGTWSLTLILGWLVFDITHSEFLLALFTAARLGPMLLGPISGVIADRFDRPRFLLVAVVWAFAAASAVATFVSIGHITYGEIVLGGFCIGLAESPSQPSRYTLVMDIVGRRHMTNANALNAIAMSATQMIGPAIGGALIALFGVPTALWVAGLWYPVSFILLWPIRDIGKRQTGIVHESPMRQLVDGIRVVLTSRMMVSVLFVSLAANVLIFPIYQTFMPVFAKSVLGLGPDGLGWMLASFGTGAIVGSLAIAWLGNFKHKGSLFVFGTAAWGGLWALFALSRSVPLSFVLLAGAGLVGSAFDVLQSTLLLMLAPSKMRGRAMGLQEMVIGVLPLATVMQGVIVNYLGLTITTVLSGSLLMLLMMGLAIAVPTLRRYSGFSQQHDPS